MKKLQLLLSACAILFCFTACSNDETPQVSQKELNLNLIQSIAKDMGVQVDVELYDRQAIYPLTKADIEYFKETFKQIAELDGQTVNLNINNTNSRVAEGFSYFGSALFNGHSFNVSVYWKKDNQTGEIFDIVGGMAGYAESDINDYQDVYFKTCCEMFHMGQTIHHANGTEISISLHSDYVATQKCYSNLLPDIGDGFTMNTTRCKVTAYGNVRFQGNTGSFVVNVAGSGSWGDDWRDDL